MNKLTIGFRRSREKRQRVEALLAGKVLLVGIDLAQKKHAVWFATREGVPLRKFMIEHSWSGMDTLATHIDTELREHSLDRAVVFMEPTAHFWRNVANVLEARGIEYRNVSSLAVDRQREIAHITYAKGDYRDAALIVQLGAAGNWLHRQLERCSLWIELHTLAYEHELLLEAEIAEKLRIRSFLEFALPEFLVALKGPTGKTALALLRALANGPDRPRTFEEVRARADGVVGRRYARAKIRRLIAALEAAPSYGVECWLSATLARIGLAVDRLDVFAHQRAAVRARLVELFLTTPYAKFLDTIPAVSQENHALVLGFIGDPKQYDRATCLAKLAGTEPRENHSGKAEGSHSISRRGISGLRHVVYRIVCGFRRGENELSHYLARLQSRETNPLAWHQAAVATGNKYLRLMHRMCVDQKTYDPSRLGGN